MKSITKKKFILLFITLIVIGCEYKNDQHKTNVPDSTRKHWTDEQHDGKSLNDHPNIKKEIKPIRPFDKIKSH